MLDILPSLAPVFALIVLGFVLKRTRFPDPAFWPPAARLVYFIFLPALLINTLATAEFSTDLWRPLVVAVGTVLLLTSLLLGLRRWLPVDGPGFTSVVQGTIRHNTYVGLATVAALYGDEGVVLIAILFAAIVPLVNVISVGTLSVFGQRTATIYGRKLWLKTAQSLISNPLILACLVGIALNLTKIGLPLGSGLVLTLLARPALPLGLLIVGAGLDLRAMVDARVPVALASGLKLFGYATLAALLGRALGVSNVALSVLVLFGALPTATSAYILALELGGDARLMAAILTAQTLLAMVSMPLVVWLLA